MSVYDADKVIFLGSVRAFITEIVVAIHFNDSSRLFDRPLTECRKALDKYIDQCDISKNKTVLRNTLIVHLKKTIQSGVQNLQPDASPNDVSRFIENEFKELFKVELCLYRNTPRHQTDASDSPNHRGPFNSENTTDSQNHSRGPNDSEYASGGAMNGVTKQFTNKKMPRSESGIHFQCTILENLHHRLSALERRMGV